MTLRIGWFATGRGEGSRALLRAAIDAVESGALDAEFAFVFCNRERGEYEATDGFIDLVESHGITCLTLSSRAFRRERGGDRSRPGEPLPEWRVEYDRAVAELIASHPFDIGVLGGYMLILTPEMARRFPFLNLHPAEPGGPVGTWQEVIWELIERRAERSGVMIHLATEELDRGPTVAYCSFSIRGPAFDPLWQEIDGRSVAELRESDGEELSLFPAIRRHGVVREPALVVATLRALEEGRVRVDGGRVVDASGGALGRGVDLSAEIDAAVAAELGTS